MRITDERKAFPPKRRPNDTERLVRSNVANARTRWSDLGSSSVSLLKELTTNYLLCVALGDLILLEGSWYVTHTGLLRLARRKRCSGISVQPVRDFCDPKHGRWAFEATVFTSPSCKGFAGYGDADASNVSPLVHGAEMRVAETRAVNRALRKAYGIGICSFEELGSLSQSAQTFHKAKKLPPQPVNGNNGNYGGPKVRDRLCQLIRQHQLDPNLVKSYAVDFCGSKTLREASREQVEAFVTHLADWAEKDRDALLCQLNSYLGSKEGAA
jgi:hypothetical protein